MTTTASSRSCAPSAGPIPSTDEHGQEVNDLISGTVRGLSAAREAVPCAG
ncbi:hypothetical protein ACH4Y0_15440 [Streptomyces sp. NPDC020707]|uniref:Uncharacterized protein n=1 Tax=Streptomyces ortus TaxID=2867268 RepID=A0ABT3VD95_9ACTN|nr:MULTISPECIES: hypothetical protein [Streptomyces]MCX4237791.1 hypothetical protein [Streptomyces ortus]